MMDIYNTWIRQNNRQKVKNAKRKEQRNMQDTEGQTHVCKA